MEDKIIFKEAVKRLLDYRVNWLPKECKKEGYVKGDENQPFFSEAYLYNLLGKDEARTLLGLMRPIWKIAGISEREQP